MVSLINSLDLSSTPREYAPDLPLYSIHSLDLDFRYYSQRSQFGFTSSNDDEIYARNLWPCSDLECTGVLSPLDRLRNGPKTVAEIYANDVRCCPKLKNHASRDKKAGYPGLQSMGNLRPQGHDSRPHSVPPPNFTHSHLKFHSNLTPNQAHP